MLKDLRMAADLKSSFSGNQSKMSQKFANAIITKAAAFVDNEMTCTSHKGLPLIAFDSVDNNFGCQ